MLQLKLKVHFFHFCSIRTQEKYVIYYNIPLFSAHITWMNFLRLTAELRTSPILSSQSEFWKFCGLGLVWQFFSIFRSESN